MKWTRSTIMTKHDDAAIACRLECAALLTALLHGRRICSRRSARARRTKRKHPRESAGSVAGPGAVGNAATAVVVAAHTPGDAKPVNEPFEPVGASGGGAGFRRSNAWHGSGNQLSLAPRSVPRSVQFRYHLQRLRCVICVFVQPGQPMGGHFTHLS
eukprot:363815-Chlamydomonas_euryale.AAC.4